MKCELCGAQAAVRKKTTKSFGRGDNLVVIENIPIIHCSSCHESYVTADTARAMRVAKQLRSGNVGINTAQRNHEAPFGGFKLSGVGRDRGSFAMHAYSELQSIVWPG
mgnify:CR=1 FL=1